MRLLPVREFAEVRVVLNGFSALGEVVELSRQVSIWEVFEPHDIHEVPDSVRPGLAAELVQAELKCSPTQGANLHLTLRVPRGSAKPDDSCPRPEFSSELLQGFPPFPFPSWVGRGGCRRFPLAIIGVRGRFQSRTRFHATLRQHVVRRVRVEGPCRCQIRLQM